MDAKRALGIGCGCLTVAGVGAVSALFGAVFLAGTAWNAGEASLAEVDATWSIRVRYGIDAKSVPAPAAMPIAAVIREQCSPSWNGVDVVWEQFWYNAIYAGYEVFVWLESPSGSYDDYGIYMSGNTMLLRDGVGRDGYHDLVLTCAMSATQLSTMVEAQVH